VIVACSSCPAQYSVPDAKIRGKKVRVTCKHCGTGIVVDATGEPRREELWLDALEALAPATIDVDDDATRMMAKRSDLSVHEEPTVIGHVSAPALEAERRHALPTAPPHGVNSVAASPTPTRALPHDVPEAALDVTNLASPQALRGSATALASDLRPVPSAPVSAAPEPMAPVSSSTHRSAPPPLQPQAELKTLLSQADPIVAPSRVARTLYWVVAGLAVLLLALALMRTTR
jgi:predicted Zn finger-like uncharacterized protein